jgi:hypothetical protein
VALSKIPNYLQDTIDSDGIGAGAISTAKLNNTLDLTGKTVINPNGMNLLLERTDGSTVDYSSDVLIFDFDTYTSDYSVFFMYLEYYPKATSGSQHFYNVFTDSSGNQANMRYATNGWKQTDSSATPSAGSGTYWRTGYSCQFDTRYAHWMYIVNGNQSDASMDCVIQSQSAWYYAGTGATFANGTCFIDDKSKLSRYYINMDQASADGGSSGQVRAKLWGLY